MLPKAHRLLPKDLRRLMKEGKRIRNGWLELVYEKTNDSPTQFAFIIGSSVDKRASRRNRIRRLLRESVHQILPMITSGCRGVVIVKSKQEAISLPRVRKVVGEVFRKAGLLGW